jgi:hypothetical protein
MYKQISKIEIVGLNYDGIAYCEAKGISQVFNAYAEFCNCEAILGVGFNPNSGYVYIALENDVQICSCLGRSVEFLVVTDEGEELFFDTYTDALDHKN